MERGSMIGVVPCLIGEDPSEKPAQLIAGLRGRRTNGHRGKSIVDRDEGRQRSPYEWVPEAVRDHR